MKKLAMFLAGLISLSVMAEEQETHQVQKEQYPTLHLAIFDMSDKVANRIKGLKYSVNQKNQELCWIALNLPMQSNNKVVEIFKSPAKAHFSSPNSEIATSKDGKTHTITSIITHSNSHLNKCWKFNNSHPKGEYDFEVRVNDVIFSGLKFEVVK